MSSRVIKCLQRGAAALLLTLGGTTVVGLTPAAVAQPLSTAIETKGLTTESVVTVPGFTFDLVKNGAVATCLPNARGIARLTTQGASQQLELLVTGLPPNNTFTVFVLQVPHSPFGMSWYQGDVQTDAFGVGRARFIGIFSDETFIQAPGSTAAPLVDNKDATTNPQTAPIHMFHIGMWFDSTAEASAAHCPTGQTPFNGDHTAGIQVLNTTNFADGDGPIGQFHP